MKQNPLKLTTKLTSQKIKVQVSPKPVKTRGRRRRILLRRTHPTLQKLKVVRECQDLAHQVNHRLLKEVIVARKRKLLDLQLGIDEEAKSNRQLMILRMNQKEIVATVNKALV